MWRKFHVDPPPADGCYLGYLTRRLLGPRMAVIEVRRGTLLFVGGRFHYDAPLVTHWMPLPDPPIE